MKKTFSLLTLLLLLCSSGAWATVSKVWNLEKTYSSASESELASAGTNWKYSSSTYTYKKALNNAELPAEDGETAFSLTAGLKFTVAANYLKLGRGYLYMDDSGAHEVEIPTTTNQYVNLVVGVGTAGKTITVTGGDISSFTVPFATKAFSINIKATGTSLKISTPSSSGFKLYIYQIAKMDAADVIAPAIPDYDADTYYKGLQISLSCATDGASIKYKHDSSARGFADLAAYSSAFSVTSTGSRYVTTCATKAVTEGTLYSDMMVYNYTIEGSLPTPVATPGAGTYTSAQNVVLSAEGILPNGVIRYTLDGKTPTSSSTEYTAAINIDETKTIKAYVFDASGSNKGSMLTAAYTINIPVLTGAWSATSGVIYEGDDVPTPSFSVTNTPAPSSSAYNIVYSLKAGSDDGVVTIGAGGASFTLNNNVVGEAIVIATLTSADLVNYKDAAETYEYSYEVKEKSPWIVLTEDEITLKSTPVTRSASTTVTLTGDLLTDGTYSVSTSATGLSVSPTSFTVEDGEVSQVFTVTYNPGDVAVAANSEVISFSDDATSTSLTVNYSSVVAHTWAITSSASTWDWEDIKSSVTNCELADADANPTTPTRKNENMILADFDGEVYTQDVNFPDAFHAEALKASKIQFAANTGGYFQGTYLKIKTSVPGTVVVKFSNTGSTDRPYRYLYINNTATSSKSKNTTAVTSDAIKVDAGEIEIKGVIKAEDNGEKGQEDQYLRIYKVVFIPAHERTVASGKYATVCLPRAIVSADGIDKFYTVAGYRGTANDITSVVITEAETPLTAGKPYIFHTNAAAQTIYMKGDAVNAPVAGDNGLVGRFTDGKIADNDCSYILRDNLVCQVEGNDVTCVANRAYFNFYGLDAYAGAPGRYIELPMSPNSGTDINNIEAAEDGVKFIQDGKLYIKKDGVIYNALGQIVR